MTGKIIDGKAIANQIHNEIKKEAQILKTEKGIVPGLAVIIAGNNPASEIYVRLKEKNCKELGFYSEKHQIEENASEEKVLTLVKELNQNMNIHGILVQLPLPKHINQDHIIEAVSPLKDVDGFHPANLGNLLSGKECFIPCTPQGIMELLKRYEFEIKGKHAVVIGRSIIVGKPLSILLLNNHATVTTCHSKTVNLAEITRQADILIAAIGRPRFIKGEMIKAGAVVIDVGMNRVEGKLYGDVDFDAAKEKASAITPVPKGVGPMTIVMLMRNTLKAAQSAALG